MVAPFFSHRLVLSFVVLAGVALVAAPGCIVIGAGLPRVVTVERDCGNSLATDLSPDRLRPYAVALDRVLRQEARVECALRTRDWLVLGHHLDCWQRYVRRLAGVADTSQDRTLMNGCCETLDEQIETMRRALRRRDITTIEALLDEAAPVLSRLSREFPLTDQATSRPADEA